jgi:hypothetical protein
MLGAAHRQKGWAIANADRFESIGRLLGISYFRPKSDGHDTEPAYHIRSMFFKGGVNSGSRRRLVEEDRCRARTVET